MTLAQTIAALVASAFEAGFKLGLFAAEGKRLIMSLRLTDVQKVKVSVRAVDAAGNETPLTTPPTFSSSDENILTVESLAPGEPNSAEVTTTGHLGTAQAQAAVGDLHALLDIEVIPSEAVSLELGAGTPEAK